MEQSGELTGVPTGLPGPRRRYRRVPAGRARRRRGPAQHGEDRARPQHRAQRGGGSRQEGRDLLAGDDEAFADAAPVGLRGPGQLHQLSARATAARTRTGASRRRRRSSPAPSIWLDDTRHDHDSRDQGEVPPAPVRTRPRPRGARLSAARPRQQAHHAQGPGDRGDQSRPQVVGQGARHSGGCALAAQPRPGAARPRQAPAQHGGSSRVGRDRAGRGPDRLHLSGRGLQSDR